MFDGATHLSMLLAADGVAITITRGATSLPVDAVRGLDKGRMVGGDGNLTKYTTVDWLVIADDLPNFVPEAGDVITCKGLTYTVAHPDPNTKAVQNFGDETAYRIHTIAD